MTANASRAAEIQTSVTDGRDKHKAQLQALARARGMAQDQVGKVAARLVPWGDIVKTAGDEARELTGERAKWAWTICSGLAHSHRWAALAFLKREVTLGAAHNLLNQKISAPVEQLPVMANIAALMVAEAWRLFDERRRSLIGR